MILATIRNGRRRRYDSEDVPPHGNYLRNEEADVLATFPEGTARRWVEARLEAWRSARMDAARGVT